jgi:hypothetical protein
MKSDASMVFLTHYSQLTNIQYAGNSLLQLVDDYVKIAEVNADNENLNVNIVNSLKELLLQRAHSHGVVMSNEYLIDILDFDIKLNASGLITWLERR